MIKRIASILALAIIPTSILMGGCNQSKNNKGKEENEVPFTGKDAWKNQVIMTVELSKFKSAEEDDNNLGGDNSKYSNDYDRFIYALDDPISRSNWEGGLIGGDLIGFRQKVGHLKDLGITTALIYPVFESDRKNLMHYLPSSYGVRNWKAIDRNFRGPGQSSDDLTSYVNLVKDLHDPKIGGYRINVIQDLPIAMSGNEHPWYKPLTSVDKADYYRYWNPNNKDINLAQSPVFFENRLYIDLTDYFNEDVFSYKTDYSDGSMGNTNKTYPAEAVGSSVWIFGSNFGYEFGNKLNGNYNAVSGSSKKDTKIDMPEAKYSSINLLAAATNGNKEVVVRVLYDDGSFTDNSIVIPDWEVSGIAGTSSYHFSYRHSQSGKENKPVYMHSIFIRNNPCKTTVGVELLKSENAEDVHIFSLTCFPIISPVKVDLTDFYNADGYSCLGNMGDGLLNGYDALIPVDLIKGAFTAAFPEYNRTEHLAAGPVLDGINNLISARGQSISIPEGRYHMFSIAAFLSSKEKTGKQTIWINYTDGTSDTVDLDVKHLEDLPGANDIVVHYSNYVYEKKDDRWQKNTSRRIRIFGYTLQADSEKKVESLTLPDNPNLYIAAVNPVILLDNSWGLPVLEHTYGMENNSGLFKYMVEDILWYWFEKADIDGYRIDSAQNFYPEFWSNVINNYIKPKYKNKIMFGEVFTGGKPWQLRTEQYTNDKDGIGFDGIYSFETLGDILSVFAKDGSSKPLIQNSIYWDKTYDKPWNQVACFDNYENQPFLGEIDNSKYPEYKDKLPKIKLAAAYLFTINRIPMLFSGNEYLISYGNFLGADTKASKPGYLFSSEVQDDPVLQDNYKILKH